jgi:hypothetical protein
MHKVHVLIFAPTYPLSSEHGAYAPFDNPILSYAMTSKETRACARL